MDKKILFVCDKICDGDPNLGWSNGFHNIFATFRQSYPDWSFNTLHIDEASYAYDTHIDKVILNYCKKFNIKNIIFALLAGSSLNPSLSTLSKLKEMGIWLGFFWPDTGWGWPIDTINDLREIANLHVSWDTPKSQIHDQYNLIKDPNHIYLWPPQDSTLYYYNDREIKDIDVSFVGSYAGYRDRIEILNKLKELFPQLVISGGQRRDKLSPEQYASIIRRSKITLNFPLSQAGVFWQSKSRIFEAAACGTMILDVANPSTKEFFNPVSEYIEYKNLIELLDQLKYYLDNNTARYLVSQNALAKYKEKYTAKHYWDLVIQHIINNDAKSLNNSPVNTDGQSYPVV